MRALYAEIGELTLESDFLGGALTKAGLLERKKMIDPTHDMAVSRQARVLEISRSAVYYRSRLVSGAELALMRRIDALHLDHAGHCSPPGGAIEESYEDMRRRLSRSGLPESSRTHRGTK